MADFLPQKNKGWKFQKYGWNHHLQKMGYTPKNWQDSLQKYNGSIALKTIRP